LGKKTICGWKLVIMGWVERDAGTILVRSIGWGLTSSIGGSILVV
jgi:hypothetical protein